MIFANKPQGNCPVCSHQVHGRKDKVYCSISCKNKFHAAARRFHQGISSDYLRQLQRNLTVMEGLLNENGSKVVIHRNALQKLGVDLTVTTHVRPEPKGIGLYIYHLRYELHADGKVSISRTEQTPQPMPLFFRRWSLPFPDQFEIGGNNRKMRRKMARLYGSS